jgi:DNA polymerase-1
MKKLVLIDSHALVHRAFHALPMLTAPDGRPTNAAYGFLSVLLKMIADLKPDAIAATFDLAGPTFRHEAFEDYKAHREKAPDELYAQIPMVKELLHALGIPIYEYAGFEADDVIGTIAEQTRAIPNLQTVIVTGDLDTLQLVEGTKVVVFTLRKGMTDTFTYDESEVKARYGLSPAQVADFKGLKGDPSDNIPGVSGIGEKTASALIGHFGSLEHVLEAATSEKPEKPLTPKLAEKLRAEHDMALFSKKLATIVRDAPVEFVLADAEWTRRVDAQALEAKCRELGFSTIVKRLSSVLNTAAAAASVQPLDFGGGAPAGPQAMLAAEPSDLPQGSAAAVHADIADGAIRALYLTVDGDAVASLENPTPARVAQALALYPALIGHDLKPLLRLLDDAQMPSAELTDTKILAWLTAPDARDYSLERVHSDVLGSALPEGPAAAACAAWRLATPLRERVSAVDMNRVMTEAEMPLIAILARMERLGIRVDTHLLKELSIIAARELAALEKSIYKKAGEEFNINSPSQLGEILFTKLGITGKVRRTAGGAPSTAAPELEKLRDEHPIIDLVLQYRELAKLEGTYIEPFPSLVAADGRVHTTYNQTGTATGRVSSNDPNMQNIPAGGELGTRFRAAFVPEPGLRLLSLDYSQLELRLVAHIAHDETMLEAFRNGEDIHTRTACEVFGIAPAQVTRDMRRQAKVLNFGIIYGMGSVGFARAAGVSRTDAKRFIDEYFVRFSGIARYMEATKQQAFEQGFVSTLLGRRRPLPDIASRIPQLAAAAERMAINHPIQGTGADLMKLAMIAISRDRTLPKSVRMLLQVHDELVFEVHPDDIGEAAVTLASLMEGVMSLEVPIVADAKAGENWAHMERVETRSADGR